MPVPQPPIPEKVLREAGITVRLLGADRIGRRRPGRR